MAGGRFDIEPIEESPGFCVLRVTGKTAVATFANEAGGHRWQRVPPTDKKGRVQTSTITVAILDEPRENEVQVSEADLTVTYMRGSGAGGQHRNKTDSAVRMVHVPTGIVVRCEAERSQHANRETALAILRARLKDHQDGVTSGVRADERRRQLGSGMRGDKRRTIRTQDGFVNDHVTGKQWRWKDYERGTWD